MSSLNYSLTEVISCKLDYPTLFAYWHKEGYVHATENIKIVDRIKFREALLKNDAWWSIDTHAINQVEVFASDELVIRLSSGNKISIFGKHPSAAANFLSAYTEHIVKLNTDNSVETYYFVATPEGVADRYIFLDLDKMPRILPELYPDVDIDRLAEQFHGGDESILILTGDPGVGKTSFIKRILCSGLYRDVGYAKDRDAICNGDFWSQVAAKNLDLLIFDDLDFGLGPRQEGDNGFVTNLLSYSDGIFNTKCKIVITTNQKLDKVDQALIRPGRCFDFLVLNPLTRLEAKGVWTDVLSLDEEGFNSIFGTKEDQVTQAKLMAEYKTVMDKKRVRDYLKRNKTSLTTRLEDMGLAERKVGFARS